MAASAEERKSAKYSNLGTGYLFTPVAIRDSGGHWKEITSLLEAGPKCMTANRGGESSCISSAMTLCGCPERECCFCDGISKEPVWDGPVQCVNVVECMF